MTSVRLGEDDDLIRHFTLTKLKFKIFRNKIELII